MVVPSWVESFRRSRDTLLNFQIKYFSFPPFVSLKHMGTGSKVGTIVEHFDILFNVGPMTGTMLGG